MEIKDKLQRPQIPQLLAISWSAIAPLYTIRPEPADASLPPLLKGLAGENLADYTLRLSQLAQRLRSNPNSFVVSLMQKLQSANLASARRQFDAKTIQFLTHAYDYQRALDTRCSRVMELNYYSTIRKFQLMRIVDVEVVR